MLSTELAVSLEATLFFRHPTPKSLCLYLEEHLNSSRQSHSTLENTVLAGTHDDELATEDSTLAELLAELEQTPEAEVRQLLGESGLVEGAP